MMAGPILARQTFNNDGRVVYYDNWWYDTRVRLTVLEGMFVLVWKEAVAFGEMVGLT